MFCVEMFQYSHYTYYLREESAHFCLKVLAQFFGKKYCTREIDNILKDF